MPVLRYYSSVAQPTTLASGISAGATTLTVLATTGFPSSFPYTLSLDNDNASAELVEVTGAAGPTLTVVRGIDGTSAQSHSAGAVVRHDISARDFADYQNHQAASSNVHGVTGALVGASSTQTLANKTLTSPIVNSGALSGTFTGSPTFSGTPVLSAGASIAGTVAGDITFSGNPTFSGAPTFNGAVSMTAGALSQRTNATDVAVRTRASADTQDRHQVLANGKHLWGDGSSTQDAVLYRAAAGQLKTDTDLVVGGSLTAGNANLGAWTAWTPTWTTSTGAHTPSYGNAAKVGSYVKIGRTLHFTFAVSFLTTTNFGGGTTNDNWLFSLPDGLAASSTYTTQQALCGYGMASVTALMTVPLVLRIDSGGTNIQVLLGGGRVDGVAISNSGAIDAATPWTWASGMSLQFSGTVECTA